jgi:hypothetical protein
VAVDAVARPQRPAAIVRCLIDGRRTADLSHGTWLARRCAAATLPRSAATTAGRFLRRRDRHGTHPDGQPYQDPLTYGDTHPNPLPESSLRRAVWTGTTAATLVPGTVWRQLRAAKCSRLLGEADSAGRFFSAKSACAAPSSGPDDGRAQINRFPWRKSTLEGRRSPGSHYEIGGARYLRLVPRRLAAMMRLD